MTMFMKMFLAARAAGGQAGNLGIGRELEAENGVSNCRCQIQGDGGSGTVCPALIQKALES
ncbi:MAG: hypothetical protein KDJ41_04855 [Hyphomicrobiaceae bacterium]|nr:hypothetical protein [Hyphomicrobiaceae bacterium]